MITPHLLEKAKSYAAETQEYFLMALIKISGESSDKIFNEVSHYTGIEFSNFNKLKFLDPDFSEINYAISLQKNCLVVKDLDKKIFIISDPFDSKLISWASYRINDGFDLVFISPFEIKKWLSDLEKSQHTLTNLAVTDSIKFSENNTEEITLSSIAKDESLVVKLVNSTLYDAHRNQASDIHLENTARGLVIKYRIDGVLTNIRHLPDLTIAEQVISRLKVMAELDISERRIPQDGRFAVNLRQRDIDFRVSIMPGLFGEDAVLRILDKQHLTQTLQGLSLHSLGFRDEHCYYIQKMARQPYGMLLVTGPTGSGKTTTLYAILSEVNTGQDKIITIEDPVEYQLSGILQIPVNEKKGLTFARGLRSILRHDPDKILVGEIRDKETAEIAVQAALTGHQVYTSVHANNVFDVLGRFRHMGIDVYSFVSALNGIVAQRLVRVICSDCSQDDQPTQQLLEDSGLSQISLTHFHFKKGAGCVSCRGTGYKGRQAIAEILVISDTIKEALLSGESLAYLKALAQKEGTVMMRQAALNLVQLGVTTLTEVNRATFI